MKQKQTLQTAIQRVKESREMGRRFMWFEEYVEEEREEAFAEGIVVSILDILSKFGSLDGELESRIRGERDVDRLRSWLAAAASADTLDDFAARMAD